MNIRVKIQKPFVFFLLSGSYNVALIFFLETCKLSKSCYLYVLQLGYDFYKPPRINPTPVLKMKLISTQGVDTRNLGDRWKFVCGGALCAPVE